MDHTFVVCAYKENPFLEDCVKSVVNQSVKSKVLISTSTPNSYIFDIATKYNLDVVVNSGIGDGPDNINFAFLQADTEYVTICHQDDYYAPDYLESIEKVYRTSGSPLVFFTDYFEDRNGAIIANNATILCKKIMLLPFKSKVLRKKVWVRNNILKFGNPICCPSVTYNKSLIGFLGYDSKWAAVVDWIAFIRIAKLDGEFCYISRPLMYHRIHGDSDTTKTIKNNLRSLQELELFRQMWPKWVAVIISKFYALGQKSNMND